MNKQCVGAEITEEIKNYFEMNADENTTYRNLWDAVKAVLQEVFLLKKNISSH